MTTLNERTTLVVAVAAAALAVPGIATALVTPPSLEDPFHEYLLQLPLPDGGTACILAGEVFFEAFEEQAVEELAAALVYLAAPGEPCPEPHHGA